MSKSLDQALRSVEELFPLVGYQDIQVSNIYIEQLYDENGFYYSLLHSLSGSMHMTIDNDSVDKVRNHHVQIQKVAEHIISKSDQTDEALKVLELGCGKGYNICYLAKRFPEVQFLGIDISEASIQEAKSKTRTLQNVTIQKMDMDYASFDPDSYHIVFDVETVCHTQDHLQLITKVYGALKEDGLFILFDNFRKGTLTTDQVLEQKALRYIEIAVGIQDGIAINEWIDLANQIGFETIVNNDLSAKILTGLHRYHQLASLYFRAPPIARVVNKVIPEKLKLYAIGAYLMKYSMELGFQAYQEIVLKK